MTAQLKQIHESMYEKARVRLSEGFVRVTDYAAMKALLEKVRVHKAVDLI